MGSETGPSDPLIGQVIEKCRILSKLGRGGMGAVYLAEHTGLKRRVAVKVLPAELARDRDYVARFQREAISAARMEHPNIVQVYNVGEHQGQPFIIMQYVDGSTVGELLETKGKFDPKEAARIGRDVARGLAAAHAQGIIHRDVKPDNIFVASTGEVRIGDFGIAHEAGSAGVTTHKGSFVGTPHYISPEQADGKGTDARSDLYSLGATLYTMVSGRPPFAGESIMSIMYKQVHEAPKRPSLYARELPAYLEDIILKLMSKKADHRYSTAAQVEADLDRFVRGVYSRPKRETTDAARGPTRRAGPAPKRGKPAAIIAVLSGVCALLIVALVVALSSKGEPPPAPPPPPPAAAKPPPPPAVNPLIAEAKAAEERGDFETAILVYRKLGDADGIKRVELKLRRKTDEKAFRDFEVVASAGDAQRTREAGQTFLRDHPDSEFAAQVRVALGRLPPSAAAEPGFTPLYRSEDDISEWGYSRRLSGKVHFTRDSLLVSYPESEGDEKDVGYIYPKQGDLQHYTYRFELRADAVPPGVNVGMLLVGEPGVPGRDLSTRLTLRDFALNQWQPVEVEVTEEHVRLTVAGRVITSGAIKQETSPFGRVCVSARPGAQFEIRNPRIKIEKRFDISSLKTPDAPTPPPKAEPAPAEAIQAVKARNYAKALAALQSAPGEPARLLRERVEAALAIQKASRDAFKKGQALEVPLRAGKKIQGAFAAMDEKELALVISGGRVAQPLGLLAPDFFLGAVKSSRAVTPLQRALFLALEDDPVAALETLGAEPAPGQREDIEAAALALADSLIESNQAAQAKAILQRLSAIKGGEGFAAALADRNDRLETAGAKNDAERVQMLVKKGKTDEAQRLLDGMLKAAKADEVGALAMQLRDLVFSRPAREIFDGQTLFGWSPAKGTEGIARVNEGRLELSDKGSVATLYSDSVAKLAGLTFDLRHRQFFDAKKGAGLMFNHRASGEYFVLVIGEASARVDERAGGAWKQLARRSTRSTPGRKYKVDLVVSGGQWYLFLDDAFLARGASAEPDALGANVALVADDVECDYGALKAYPGK